MPAGTLIYFKSFEQSIIMTVAVGWLPWQDNIMSYSLHTRTVHGILCTGIPHILRTIIRQILPIVHVETT